MPLTPSTTADVREPISSACIATPFNNDGQACQGGAIGTPFFLFTNGTSPRSLFADAYQPDYPGHRRRERRSGRPRHRSAARSTRTAHRWRVVPVRNDDRLRSDDGSLRRPARTMPPDSFSAQLTGLAPGTTIHYRAVATSDFGTFLGADRQFTTASQTPPPLAPGTASAGRAKVKGTTAKVRVSCEGASGATCSAGVQVDRRRAPARPQGRQRHRGGQEAQADRDRRLGAGEARGRHVADGRRSRSTGRARSCSPASTASRRRSRSLSRSATGRRGRCRARRSRSGLAGTITSAAGGASGASGSRSPGVGNVPTPVRVNAALSAIDRDFDHVVRQPRTRRKGS